jgi:hypothetical protein
MTIGCQWEIVADVRDVQSRHFHCPGIIALASKADVLRGVAMCQEATSFDYLVGAQKKRCGHL